MPRGLALPVWAIPLVGAALASAALHLWAEHRAARAVAYVAKPLTTTLLLVLALVLPGTDGVYRAAVAAGLAASLAGDVWLMLPRDRFVAGLASFLVAHLAYLVAFTRVAPLGSAPVALVPYAAVGAALVAVLWPRLGRLRLPVALYAAALVLMAGQAAAGALSVGGTPARLAALGGALFVVSDAVLAVDRFRAPVRRAQLWIMCTYVAAQLCIALSVAPAHPRPAGERRRVPNADALDGEPRHRRSGSVSSRSRRRTVATTGWNSGSASFHSATNAA